MKQYLGKRTPERNALVYVRDTDESGIAHYSHLTHHIRHSPDGFNWGYSGSGPAELARCILIDFLDNDRVAGGLYQEFKARVIARLDQDRGWEIPQEQIVAFLASPAAQVIDAWLEEEKPDASDEEWNYESWSAEQDRENADLKARFQQQPVS